MKRYTITDCKNELVKIVSVSGELTATVESALNELPYVDRASCIGVLKTQIMVELSSLAEQSDLEEMAEIIRQIVTE